MNIVYLSIFIRVPELMACQVYNHKLVDEKLESTYKRIPRLPRYLKLFQFISLLYLFLLEWQTLHQPMDCIVTGVVFNFLRFFLTTSQPM